MRIIFYDALLTAFYCVAYSSNFAPSLSLVPLSVQRIIRHINPNIPQQNVYNEIRPGNFFQGLKIFKFIFITPSINEIYFLLYFLKFTQICDIKKKKVHFDWALDLGGTGKGEAFWRTSHMTTTLNIKSRLSSDLLSNPK